MGNRPLDIVIHHNPAIEWHKKRADDFRVGLQVLGFNPILSTSTKLDHRNPCVLFGTSSFKEIEASPLYWLLVDRACWGDPDNVRLGWNNRGAYANYCIPADPEVRATRKAPQPVPREPGERVIICGDYNSVPEFNGGTHFKPHPAQPDFNPTDLPTVHDFEDCRYAVVGSSTVSVELKLRGIDVIIVDPRNMGVYPLDDLAWCQWSWSEIRRGEPVRHLFEWLKYMDSGSFQTS